MPPVPVARRRPNARTGGYVGLEKKFIDQSFTGNFSSTWAGGELDPTGSSVLTLGAAAIGDGPSDRDGRQVKIHSIYIKGVLTYAAQESLTAPPDDQIVRVALVLDRQTNKAQLNAEDVFGTIGAGLDVYSVRNLEYVKRFKILKDKTWRMPVSTAVVNEGAVNQFAMGQVSIPFKLAYTFRTPITVEYASAGTTGVIASIVDNSFHLIGTASSTTAGITYRCRTRFTC